MKNIKIRAIIAILITVIIWFVGDYFIAASNDGVALAYVGAIIGGGCFWIGSRP